MAVTPRVRTSGQFIASKILQGYSGAPLESLCEISHPDVARLEASLGAGKVVD